RGARCMGAGPAFAWKPSTSPIHRISHPFRQSSFGPTRATGRRRFTAFSPRTGDMHKLSLRKPDGRALHLYSRSPIMQTAARGPPAVPAMSHFRWHPLRGEWVAYAGHRQNRTFLPPPNWNPLRPSNDPEHPTELPVGDYEVAVFENLFPTL